MGEDIDESGIEKMSYSSYLRLHDLLSLQSGQKGNTRTISTNELHFIIVHQNFELWFKLILSELRTTRDLLAQVPVPEKAIPESVHHLERITEIFKLMTQQWKVMETLTPQQFLAFRGELGTASGFESWQMRELESLVGQKDHSRVNDSPPSNHFKKMSTVSEEDSKAWKSLENAMNEKSIIEVVSSWLSRTPIQGSEYNSESDDEVVNEFVENYLQKMKENAEKSISKIERESSEYTKIKSRYEQTVNDARDFLLPEGKVNRTRAGLLFIESYRDLPLLSWPRKLIDCLVALEESMVVWRHNHARMVERIIGRRVGTGGSSGVDYLDMTTKYRVFTDLWGVRTLLLKTEDLPELINQEYYSFHK